MCCLMFSSLHVLAPVVSCLRQHKLTQSTWWCHWQVCMTCFRVFPSGDEDRAKQKSEPEDPDYYGAFAVIYGESLNNGKWKKATAFLEILWIVRPIPIQFDYAPRFLPLFFECRRGHSGIGNDHPSVPLLDLFYIILSTYLHTWAWYASYLYNIYT